APTSAPWSFRRRNHSPDAEIGDIRTLPPPANARWAQQPQVWWLSAMTRYLWHIPPLLALYLVFDHLGYPALTRPPRLHRAVGRAAAHHGHVGSGGLRDAAPCGEQPAAAVGRRLRCAAWRAQPGRGRAVVPCRCGDAGLGRLGPQGPGFVPRRGDA